MIISLKSERRNTRKYWWIFLFSRTHATISSSYSEDQELISGLGARYGRKVSVGMIESIDDETGRLCIMFVCGSKTMAV